MQALRDDLHAGRAIGQRAARARPAAEGARHETSVRFAHWPSLRGPWRDRGRLRRTFEAAICCSCAPRSAAASCGCLTTNVFCTRGIAGAISSRCVCAAASGRRTRARSLPSDGLGGRGLSRHTSARGAGVFARACASSWVGESGSERSFEVAVVTGALDAALNFIQATRCAEPCAACMNSMIHKMCSVGTVDTQVCRFGGSGIGEQP